MRLDFLEIQRQGQGLVRPTEVSASTGQQQWSPPTQRAVKLNFDAGLDVANRVGGLGLVLRDSSSHFIAARSAPLKGIVDPLIAEAIAAREGLLFALSLAVENVLMEGDSLSLI
ncbi:hypothetical protein Vadar_026620 [Vaccinium darrowii]|uniref:Uncharacterized protein n=1 Tax=Vaccinium darrowii TaxID=229202 RepID=A0ACB7YG94_9ERIC|nr:hypothetical protein Vadar_026620 [Vaccinium darrowii]